MTVCDMATRDFTPLHTISCTAYMIRRLQLNRPFVREIRGRRESVHESLSAFKEHFSSEIGTFDAILADENMSELDKMRWIQDRQCFEELLEAVNTFLVHQTAIRLAVR